MWNSEASELSDQLVVFRDIHIYRFNVILFPPHMQVGRGTAETDIKCQHPGGRSIRANCILNNNITCYFSRVAHPLSVCPALNSAVKPPSPTQVANTRAYQWGSMCREKHCGSTFWRQKAKVHICRDNSAWGVLRDTYPRDGSPFLIICQLWYPWQYYSLTIYWKYNTCVELSIFFKTKLSIFL